MSINALTRLYKIQNGLPSVQQIVKRIPMLLHAEYVKLAVAADQDGNFPVAFENYKIALDYFSAHLKYEKNPRAKETITQKVSCSKRPPDLCHAGSLAMRFIPQ